MVSARNIELISHDGTVLITLDAFGRANGVCVIEHPAYVGDAWPERLRMLESADGSSSGPSPTSFPPHVAAPALAPAPATPIPPPTRTLLTADVATRWAPVVVVSIIVIMSALWLRTSATAQAEAAQAAALELQQARERDQASVQAARDAANAEVQRARASEQAARESEARATTALAAATEATTAHANATADEPVHRGSMGSSAPTTTQPDPPNAGSKACATEAQIQVCVSSVLPTAGVNTADYGPQSLFDSETADAWVEGEDDDGIGQWIVLSWSAPRPVRGFVIANGYGKSPGLFKSNSRVRSMLLSFAGGEQTELQLNDTSKERQYLLERTITTTWVRFEIRDVIRGSRYRDTAVSGLRPLFE
jgi:hypothetical protein